MRVASHTGKALEAARWSVALTMVALLFSPPLTTLAEVALVACFVVAPDLRARLLAALRQPLVRAGLALYALISIGTLYSIVPWHDSLSMWWSWRKLLLLPLAAAVFDDTHWKRRLAWILIAVATLCALVSYLSLIMNLNIYKYRPGITIRSHATQGMIFAVAAFTAAVLWRSAADLKVFQRRFLEISVVLLLASIVYVTPGRSGYLVLMVLCATFAMFLVRGPARYALAVLVPALAAVLLATSPIARQRVTEALHEIRNYDQSLELTSMGRRVVMWENTLDLIGERPWFGCGTGGFEQAYRHEVVGVSGWQGLVASDPHNQFLNITAEYGLFGLAVFLAFILFAFRQKASSPYRILGLGVLVSWCATSLFSSHFSTFSEGRFLALWCGAMLALESGDSTRRIDP